MENNKHYKVGKKQFGFIPLEGDRIRFFKKNNQLYILKDDIIIEEKTMVIEHLPDLPEDEDDDDNFVLEFNPEILKAFEEEEKEMINRNIDRVDRFHYISSVRAEYKFSKKVYIVLALLLGILGAHRFYSNKPDAMFYLVVVLVTPFLGFFTLISNKFIVLIVFIILALLFKVGADIYLAIAEEADKFGRISL